jgi:2Fe-2S ferredoxin
MVKITYIDSFGEARTIEAQEDSTVMEAAIRNGIPEIAAECVPARRAMSMSTKNGWR